MELATYAMTAKIANHTITILLAMLLDSMTDITYKRVRLGNLHTDFQAFLGYANQLLLFRSSLAANDEHTAGVSVIAIYDGCHVHIDDIALFEHILFLRNTMANHFVDRGTNALRITFVIETRRNGIMILAILHAEIINLLGVDSRTDHLGYRIKTTGVYDTTLADAFYLFWSFNQVTGRNKFTLVFPKHYLLVELCKRLTWQAMPSFLLNHCIMYLIFATAKVHFLLQSTK